MSYRLKEAIKAEVRRQIRSRRRAQRRAQRRVREAEKFDLQRDGKTVFTGTEAEIYAYLHRKHSFSVDHALKYEGYKIVPQGRESARSS